MREHPIPQDITNYKFHLIGNMTIKQFAELFAGVILALITNASNLIVIVKYPLAISFVILGAMLAFVPIEERPLDHWLITFFKVLYKPTKFFWKRDPKIPEAFNYQSTEENNNFAPDVDLNPLRRARIQEYLSSVAPTQIKDDWEIQQNQQVAGVLEIFSQTPTILPSPQPKTKYKPNLKTRIRNISVPTDQPTETIIFDQHQLFTIPVQPQSDASKEQSNRTPYVSNQHMIGSEEIATEVVIPETEDIRVNGKEKKVEEERFVQDSYLPNERAFSQIQEDQNLEIPQQIYEVALNDNLPFPDKPMEPNKLAGMVFNTEGEILPNTIVEITNEAGQVVRAVKTNPLGQFYITTPLDDGTYYINLEKDSLHFYTFIISLVGDRVPPLEIYSQN